MNEIMTHLLSTLNLQKAITKRLSTGIPRWTLHRITWRRARNVSQKLELGSLGVRSLLLGSSCLGPSFGYMEFRDAVKLC